MALFRRRRKEIQTTRTGALGAAIQEGWNSLPWGAPLAMFTARFPRAHLTESGWWQTGQGPEPFCGVPMAITQYAFNRRDELYTVTFIPDTQERQRLSVAAVNALGPPDGMDLVWTLGDVVVEVKVAGVIAIVSHPKYSDR